MPDIGITVSNGSYSLGQDIGLVRHEFGHILQLRMIGAEKYLKYVGRESLASTFKQHFVDSYHHKTFWTEVWANNLSWNYFSNTPGALQQTLWDGFRFLLRWNSLDDFFRVKKLINYGF